MNLKSLVLHVPLRTHCLQSIVTLESRCVTKRTDRTGGFKPMRFRVLETKILVR